MPHLTLEYTNTVRLDAEFPVVLGKLHDALATIGGINIENCKSRVYVAENFFIGEGGDRNGFVRLDIRFLEGRPPEIKRRIGQEAKVILSAWCLPLNAALDLQLTVEVRDIDRAFYFKHPEGTFSPVAN